MKDNQQLRDKTPAHGLRPKSVIMVILFWAVLSLTPLGQLIGIDNGKAALAASVEFGPNQVFFLRGEGTENVGTGEWFIDIDGNGNIDYVFNEASTKKYKVHKNKGNADFDAASAQLFKRGDDKDNVGSGEWFVDINQDGTLDYVYNEDKKKAYKAHINYVDGNFIDEPVKLFDRGGGSENVGTEEWFVDINVDSAVDYVYNEASSKNYKVHMNDGNGGFTENSAQLFQRGNDKHDVGSGEWFVDLNKDDAVD